MCRGTARTIAAVLKFEWRRVEDLRTLAMLLRIPLGNIES